MKTFQVQYAWAKNYMHLPKKEKTKMWHIYIYIYIYTESEHVSRSVVSDSWRPPWTAALPGSSVHRTFPARILEWVAMPSSRASSRPRDRARISRTAGRFFPVRATREAHPHTAPRVKETAQWGAARDIAQGPQLGARDDPEGWVGGGWGPQEGEGTCIHTADSHCWAAESNTL